MLKRKSIVIAGGFDVANVPEINYGLSNSLFHTLYARYALNNCDLVLPISKSSYEETLSFAKPRKCELLYCGIELKKNVKQIKKKKQALTVGAVNKISSLRKGHFRFIEVARRLPDVPFILVGRQKGNTIDTLKKKATSNVTFYNFLPDEELDNIFAQSKVYLQLSYHEAFGLTVVEAMSMGCTPIVSNRTALPEIVGDCGVIVEPDNYDGVAEKVKEVLEHWPDYNEKGSERAVQFDIKIRAEKLLQTVRAMVS
jgi:glycosyltransferase involved in cell wall biosynthesis